MRLKITALKLSALFLLLNAFLCLDTTSARGAIISYQVKSNEVIFKLDKGLMKIIVCKNDVVEVKYTAFNQFPKFNSLIIDHQWKYPAFKFDQDKTEYIITTGKIKVAVNKITNAITYKNLKGEIITSESSENKTMRPATIAGINTYTVSTQFNSPADEALYGLGCHPEDSLSINYKGRNQDLIIRYMTGAIPVLLSTKGYGLMWDNYSASNFYGTIDNNTKFKYVSESGKQVDYYFFYGPDFDQIINLYRIATGKAPMYAKWAFGLFQSQDKYTSQKEILSVKDNYRNNHIPVDVIVQDWYYWDPLPIGSHVMQPGRYPDPKAMMDELHKAHIHGMISIWPVFGKGTKDYDALKKIGGLTDITWDNIVTHTFDNYYDAHNPKARELYWEQARDSLVKRYGWDAWWIDQCEPDNGTLLDARRQTTYYPGRGIDYFNSYSLEHTKGIYAGWRRDIPGKRAYFLARQAFAGTQRNAATLWSSDIFCSFKSLQEQVPQAINSCASGIPYWTSDIGGYQYHWKAPDWSKPEFRELFTRWFQFGAFCPIFRIHGKGERALFSNNWDAGTKEILLKFDNLRYRLLPYIYSLAGRVTMDNYTIMRSLAFDFRNDPNVYSIPDQYMFGPAFLVNPVTEQGDRSRKVYLPAAAKWYDFWTGERLNGGRSVDAQAPIAILPLYVRAGSIIPMGPKMEYATQKPGSNIELRVYPGADGSFKMYEDENDNYDYEKGAYATFTFTWNDKTRQLVISDTKGNFPGMLKHHTFNIMLVDKDHGTGAGISSKFDKVVQYSGKAIVVKL